MPLAKLGCVLQPCVDDDADEEEQGFQASAFEEVLYHQIRRDSTVALSCDAGNFKA